MTRKEAAALIPDGELYACDGSDDLIHHSHHDPTDAVEEWVDGFAVGGDTLEQAIARVPMPVVVRVYRHKEITQAIVDHAADDALDTLREAFEEGLREFADDRGPWPDAALTEAKGALLEVARRLFAHGEVLDCYEAGSAELDAEQVAALLGDG